MEVLKKKVTSKPLDFQHSLSGTQIRIPGIQGDIQQFYSWVQKCSFIHILMCRYLIRLLYLNPPISISVSISDFPSIEYVFTCIDC